MDFLTADTHFGHANVIHFDPRPFATIEERDEALIDRWNAKVKDRHRDVFHLGDFAFRNKRPIEWYTSRLYGRIHLIFGNHDDKGARRFSHLFASTHEALYLRKNGYKISLYHYAQRTWRSAHHGSWALTAS
jgi:calcineurin-like phosphoesterase family protein